MCHVRGLAPPRDKINDSNQVLIKGPDNPTCQLLPTSTEQVGKMKAGRQGRGRRKREREGEGRKKTMYGIACMSKHVSHQWCVTELRVKTSRDKVACVCVRVCVKVFCDTVVCVCQNYL